VEVLDTLILARPIPKGYTYTISSRLGNFLTLTERQFGGRDQTYTILGIEFQEDGPRIWYPCNCRHVVVQLNSQCANDYFEALFELAHECVHLLSPTGKSDANVLEEGLATLFSLRYRTQDLGQTQFKITDPRYISASRAAEQLLDIDPNAVVKLRKNEPTISRITADQIIKQYPGVSESLAGQLTSRF
jgi:hypothetical protein